MLSLVLLNNFPVFQGITFTSLSFLNLIYILKLKPFEQKTKNKIEAVNESLILIASYFVFCWQYSNPNLVNAKGENKFKEIMSWLLIAIIFFAFVLNLSISLRNSCLSTYRDMK